MDRFVYNSGLLIVGDELRFATNRDVMIIALLVLNALYTRRQSLNNDLKRRLEVVWIDFNSIVDSIVILIRTGAQLIEGNGRVESFAHNSFLIIHYSNIKPFNRDPQLSYSFINYYLMFRFNKN
jgi:hypothetical protein